MNIYDILNVNNTNSIDDIKKSYKSLAMKFHPDRNLGDKEKEKKFKEIQEAYSILSNEEKKREIAENSAEIIQFLEVRFSGDESEQKGIYFYSYFNAYIFEAEHLEKKKQEELQKKKEKEEANKLKSFKHNKSLKMDTQNKFANP